MVRAWARRIYQLGTAILIPVCLGCTAPVSPAEHPATPIDQSENFYDCGYEPDGSCPSGCVTVLQDIHDSQLRALGYFCGRPIDEEANS